MASRPRTILKAGVSVTLTPQNISLYRRIISNYEGNALDEKFDSGKLSAVKANPFARSILLFERLYSAGIVLSVIKNSLMKFLANENFPYPSLSCLEALVLA